MNFTSPRIKADANTDGAAPETQMHCTIESDTEYDFDGDGGCDSDEGFTMEPNKPYAATADTVDARFLVQRTASGRTVIDLTTAAGNAFATPELLERILAKLHPFDLFSAARVSPQWQDLVENSKKLQRALFLLPVEGTMAYFHADATDPTDYIANGSGIWSSSPYEIKPITVYVNPLVHARSDTFLPSPAYRITPPTTEQRIPDLYGKAWQRMLLTQPPMGDVMMRWPATDGGGDTSMVTYHADDLLYRGVSLVQKRKLARDFWGKDVVVNGVMEMEQLGCAENLAA